MAAGVSRALETSQVGSRVLAAVCRLSVVLVVVGQLAGRAEIAAVPANVRATASAAYRVAVDGAPVFTEKYKAVNCAWFSLSGRVKVSVRASAPIKTFTISPRAAGVTGTFEG